MEEYNLTVKQIKTVNRIWGTSFDPYKGATLIMPEDPKDNAIVRDSEGAEITITVAEAFQL